MSAVTALPPAKVEVMEDLSPVATPLGFDDWYRREFPVVRRSLGLAAGDVGLGEEAAAEAFARAYERWDRISTMSSPGGWVHQVGLNLLKRRWQRRVLERRLLTSQVGRDVDTIPGIRPDLWAAIRALPERQRIVVALRLVADLSEQATGEAMGISRGAVSSALVAARRTLQEQLNDEGKD